MHLQFRPSCSRDPTLPLSYTLGTTLRTDLCIGASRPREPLCSASSSPCSWPALRPRCRPLYWRHSVKAPVKTGMTMAQQQVVKTIHTWVQQLRTNDEDKQAEAAHELGLLAYGESSHRDLVVCAGAIPPVIALLSSPRSIVQEHAAGLLSTLASGCAGRSAIPAADTVPALVYLLRDGNVGVQRNAALALSNLAHGSCSNKAAIISADAVGILDVLCDSSNIAVQQAAASALCSVAAGSSQLESLIATRALPTLVRQLKPDISNTNIHQQYIEFSEPMLKISWSVGSSPDMTAIDAEDIRIVKRHAAQIVALHTLYGFLNDSKFHASTMVSLQIAAGVPEAAVALIKSGKSMVQRTAARLLMHMMDADSSAATSIAAAGVIPALIPMLQNSRFILFDVAAHAFLRLVMDSEDNKAAFVAAGGLSVLAAAVEVQEKQQHALRLLDELAYDSDSVIAAAATAGIIPPLVQLVNSCDRDIADQAKSVLKELGSDNCNNRAAICAAGELPVLIAVLEHEDDEA